MNWRQRRPLAPPIGSVLARLPVYPGSWLFARLLNATLAPQLAPDTRAGLEGKLLQLRVSDMGVAFNVSWRGSGFAPYAAVAAPDLAVAASLHDLWLLARREEDPDSLFFRRRLTLEGDTELGLLFKNAIDAFDLGAFDLFLQRLTPFQRPAGPGRDG
ncbi:sterol-binding protein [Massilia eurypsychrophila]|jgi:predicted lipid carrier protein YhbT|uniref:Ubiquinone biosynthesis accessory factor UbiT n=1 Tax=Massilia eurypsychrophila TaxID=1485217 RepID=A0A2G8TCQ8_9BURK|nr:SCP2 sterol-binding domain-containing protein [Massilia eurypsychrophila]PIL43749.1 sterol-binding protein [Massilia eurypsychrophila]